MPSVQDSQSYIPGSVEDEFDYWESLRWPSVPKTTNVATSLLSAMEARHACLRIILSLKSSGIA